MDMLEYLQEQRSCWAPLEGEIESPEEGVDEDTANDEAIASLWAGSRKTNIGPHTKKSNARIAKKWEEFVSTNAKKKWAKAAGLWNARDKSPCPYPDNGVPDRTSDMLKDPPVMTRFLYDYYLSHSGMYGHARPCLRTIESVEIMVRRVLASRCKWRQDGVRNDFIGRGPCYHNKRSAATGSQSGLSPWQTSRAIEPLVREFKNEFTADRNPRKAIRQFEVDILMHSLQQVHECVVCGLSHVVWWQFTSRFT